MYEEHASRVHLQIPAWLREELPEDQGDQEVHHHHHHQGDQEVHHHHHHQGAGRSGGTFGTLRTPVTIAVVSLRSFGGSTCLLTRSGGPRMRRRRCELSSRNSNVLRRVLRSILILSYDLKLWTGDRAVNSSSGCRWMRRPWVDAWVLRCMRRKNYSRCIDQISSGRYRSTRWIVERKVCGLTIRSHAARSMILWCEGLDLGKESRLPAIVEIRRARKSG